MTGCYIVAKFVLEQCVWDFISKFPRPEDGIHESGKGPGKPKFLGPGITCSGTIRQGIFRLTQRACSVTGAERAGIQLF